MSIDPNTGIWSLDVAKKRHRFDRALAIQISKMYSPKLAADVGCGNGSYCRIFKSLGWPVVHGYEGTPNIKELKIYDDIMVLDLTLRRWVEIVYDFVLCLEVGEHVPKMHEQTFIDNICEFTKKDLVLSWAIPGQGGGGHFNEQPNEYVIEEFGKRELKFDLRQSEILRENASLRWFRNTIMVFGVQE